MFFKGDRVMFIKEYRRRRDREPVLGDVFDPKQQADA